jgi:hypothetical protein
VSALQQIVTAQMKMCELMKPAPEKKGKWSFDVSRDAYGNIVGIEANHQ